MTIEKYRFDVALEDLQTFIAVAELGSFSAAAKQLNLSQPSVSNRIRRLEDKLGVKLLLRTTRKVEPTTEGRRLQVQAADTLLNLRALLQEFHLTARSRDLTVDVAATLTIATVALPPILRAFQKTDPAITVHLHDLREDEAMLAVIEGRCDMAVMTCEAPLAGIEVEQLVTDECVVVTPLNHPLTRGTGASLADVLGYPIVSPPAYLSLRRAIEAQAEPRGLTVHLAPEASDIKSMVTCLAMAAAGLGVFICGRSLIAPEFLPTISVVEFADCTIVRRFGVLTAKNRDLGSAARRFRNLLRHVRADGSGWHVGAS